MRSIVVSLELGVRLVADARLFKVALYCVTIHPDYFF